MLCSSRRCPRRVKRPHSHSTPIIPSHHRPSRSSQQGQHHRCHMACRFRIQTQVTWIPSSGRLSHRLPVIPSGTQSSRLASRLRLTTSTRCESHSCRPVSPPLRATASWSLICKHLRPLPRATASPIPAAATWETPFMAPRIFDPNSLLEAPNRPLAADRARQAGECALTNEHSLWSASTVS